MARLDQFVSKQFDVSRNEAKRLIENNQVSINGEIVMEKSLQVNIMDEIQVQIEETTISACYESASQLEKESSANINRNGETTASQNTASQSTTAEKTTSVSNGNETIVSQNSIDDAITSQNTSSATSPKAKVFCIDVECVATGSGHLDRTPGRLVMVDEYENIVFDAFVKPTVAIFSCLTQLTGIVPEQLEDAKPLHDVIEELRKVLPKDGILVGQGIGHDIKWLGLEEGKDFQSKMDIAEFFKVQLRNGYFRYFSLRHEVLYLSGFEGAGNDIQQGVHDPSIDALYSIRVYNRFKNAQETELNIMRNCLLRAPFTPSFSKMYPILDGVHMRPPYNR